MKKRDQYLLSQFRWDIQNLKCKIYNPNILLKRKDIQVFYSR